jgi:hypothetical protein
MTLERWKQMPFLDDTFPLGLEAPFTRRQALSAGVPARWLTDLVRSGHLKHPLKGCFLPAQVPDGILTRAACLRLVVPPDAVVVDRHAGWLLGANMLLKPNEHLNLLPVSMFLPAGRGRLRNKLAESGERAFGPDDLTEVHGIRCTTGLRTGLDLGRQRWPEPALTALDALHRIKAFELDELVDEVGRFRRMRWVSTLRLVAPHTDGRSQSGGETVVRWRWKQLPLPSPQPQVEVTSHGRTAFIDVGDAASRFGVEYNGAEWHTSPEDREHDEARASWLDADEGWELRPVVAADVYPANNTFESILMTGFAAAVARTRRRAA